MNARIMLFTVVLLPSAGCESNSGRFQGSAQRVSVAAGTDNPASEGLPTGAAAAAASSTSTNTGTTASETTGSEATSTPMPAPSLATGTPAKGECKVNLNYNPADIRCELGVAGPNVWTNTSGWAEAAAAFPDRSAKWISPLAAADLSGGGVMGCPSVPVNEKLIYVSYVVIPHDGTYEVSVLDDNGGSFRLWKGGAPSQEVVNVSNPNLNRHRVSLMSGFHSIVVEGHDTGVASSIILSIADPSNGSILKRTESSSGDWCIFRVSLDTDPKTFIPDAARCRKCFTGP